MFAAALLGGTAAFAADGQEKPESGGIIDMPHLRDPSIELPRSGQVLDERLAVLWLKALRRDDAALKIQAMQAFAEAHRMTGERFDDEVRAAIVEHLAAAQPDNVRLAAAGAAVELDERSAIEGLMALEREPADPYTTPVADRALAAWDHEPMRAVWRQRAADRALPHAVRVSAVESLGVVGDADAADLLTGLCENGSEPTDLRFAAATALGRFVTGGLTERAAALSETDAPGALLATRTLAAHHDDATLTLLASLTAHANHAVAADAARLLVVHAPRRLDLALAAHGDPQVRLAATQAAITAPSPDTVRVLADRLDDPSVTVRKLARNTLIVWANEGGLRDAVTVEIERVWPSAGWRGREQAALIAGWIDHKPMAEALAGSLADDRPEVRLAVAGALRQLQVGATGAAMTQRLSDILDMTGEALSGSADLSTGNDSEATQLLLALGELKHREAEPLYRKIVPKGSVPYGEARAAAIYVLGYWYEGVGNDELERQFVARMTDASVTDPEFVRVQQFCALSLGRMAATDRLDDLNGVAFNAMTPGGPLVQKAAMWSIEKLTGEHHELPAPQPSRIRGWFLEPAG